MKNWTIKKRIVTGGIALLSLLMLVSGLGIYNFFELKRLAEVEMRDDAIPCLANIAEMAEYSLRSYIRVILAGTRGSDTVNRTADIKKVEELSVKVAEAAKAYESVLKLPEDQKNFTDLMEKRKNFKEAREFYFSLLHDNKQAEATLYLHDKLDPVFSLYRDQMAKMLEWNQKDALDVTKRMAAKTNYSMVINLVIGVISLIFSLIFGISIIRSTNLSLTTVSASLRDASTQVSSAAAQVSASSHSLAEGASEQAASLEETSASMEEISSMVQQNAEHTKNAQEESVQAEASVEESLLGMKDLRNTVSEVYAKSQEMTLSMDSIKQASGAISKIIKTIDEIAFQTNILALNAAVEAARAGEAGLGFAVVADEVRNLAKRSADAAKETTTIIQQSIDRSNQGVAVNARMGETLSEVLKKAELVDLGLSLVFKKADKVKTLLSQIAAASNEQAQGISQIKGAISQMDKVTQSNAANAEETASAATELTSMAESLQDFVRTLMNLVEEKSGSETTPTVHVNPSHHTPKTVANRPLSLK